MSEASQPLQPSPCGRSGGDAATPWLAILELPLLACLPARLMQFVRLSIAAFCAENFSRGGCAAQTFAPLGFDSGSPPCRTIMTASAVTTMIGLSSACRPRLSPPAVGKRRHASAVVAAVPGSRSSGPGGQRKGMDVTDMRQQVDIERLIAHCLELRDRVEEMEASLQQLEDRGRDRAVALRAILRDDREMDRLLAQHGDGQLELPVRAAAGAPPGAPVRAPAVRAGCAARGCALPTLCWRRRRRTSKTSRGRATGRASRWRCPRRTCARWSRCATG